MLINFEPEGSESSTSSCAKIGFSSRAHDHEYKDIEVFVASGSTKETKIRVVEIVCDFSHRRLMNRLLDFLKSHQELEVF
jgi:hypothetical protein